jgi:hypothetical protein
MGFTYLGGMNWEEITREERYFCLHLYNEIKKGGEKDFVKWLLNLKIDWNEDIKIDESSKKATFKKDWLLNSNDNDWEVGFEVCFYRDIIRRVYTDRIDDLLTVKNPKGIFSPKRTFDLCLFSSNFMIIIEAKGYGGFDNDQMDVFKEDFDKLKELLGDKCPNIALIGLCRGKYRPKEKTKKNFHAIFRWADLFNKYHNPVFERIEDPNNN